MSAFSDYLEAELINATLRGGTYAGGLTYISLHTANPTDAATGGTECSYAGYARQSAGSPASSAWDAPGATNGQTKNTNAITFPAVAGPSIQATHFGIWSAVSGGNLLYHAALTTPKNLDAGDVPHFPAQSLVLTLA